jgi:hypothetical protein
MLSHCSQTDRDDLTLLRASRRQACNVLRECLESLGDVLRAWECAHSQAAFWYCIMCLSVAMPYVCVCTHMYRHICVHVHRTGLHCQISASFRCEAGQQGVGLEVLVVGGDQRRARGVVVSRARLRVVKAVCADHCAT